MRFLKLFQFLFFLVSCLSIVGFAACGHAAAPSQAYSPPPVYWTPPDQTEPAKVPVPAIEKTTPPTKTKLRSKDGTVSAVYAIPDGWRTTPSVSADTVSLKAAYDYSGATCFLDTYDAARTLSQYTAIDKAAVMAELLNTWETIKADDVHFPEEKTEGFVVSYADTDDDKRTASTLIKFMGDNTHGAWLNCNVSGSLNDTLVLADSLDKFFKSFRYSPN